jgi:hypothetical protein
MVKTIDLHHPYLNGRGKDFCRGCLGENLFSALDLGELPIANELLSDRNSKIEKFPLHLRICLDCNLGQVADVVSPERIFRDYRYLSSMSTTFLKHASNYVDQRIQETVFTPTDWVLEIASNDGYLLKNFVNLGITAIGIEPAENVASISRSLGIKTISEFFTSKLANDLLSEYGYPKLIIANNVMAHVPDLVDFVKGLALLSGPDTQVSIENPSLANILEDMQFDTIYHEHYSYLSASAVAKIGRMNGLDLIKVEQIDIHGGSNRYWLTKSSLESTIHDSVKEMISRENEMLLFTHEKWSGYSLEVENIMEGLSTWLRAGKTEGKRIYGYGAAAKASTILNSIEVEPGSIIAIADKSLEKQDRYMPPNGVKVISPQKLFLENPTDVLIFPWNIKAEITEYLNANLDTNVRMWCVIPTMHQVVVN